MLLPSLFLALCGGHSGVYIKFEHNFDSMTGCFPFFAVRLHNVGSTMYKCQQSKTVMSVRYGIATVHGRKISLPGRGSGLSEIPILNVWPYGKKDRSRPAGSL